MHTFFVKYAKTLNVGEAVSIEDKDDCFHIARSLRMAIGEHLKLSDGECQYIACLTSIRDDRCEAVVEEVLGKHGEAPYSVTVYQALPKGDKLETVIQKSTELGAVAIIPFVSEYCTARPKDEKNEERKTERRRAIAREAAKQCGRTSVPHVWPTVSFDGMLSEIKKADAALFACELEKSRTLRSVLEETSLKEKSIALIVGSEGGFSEAEAESIRQAGAISVTLGERILRAESASLYVLSALSCYLEL